MSDATTQSPGIAAREVFELGDLVHQSEDSIVSRTLLNSRSGSLTLFAFAESQKLSEHTCPYDAFAHVLEGTAEIVIGGFSTIVNQGQVLLMPANVPHAVNARQKFKMLLTMFKVNSE